MKRKIPLFKTYWDEQDIKRVTDVIKRGSYWATGPEIKEFESKIAEYVGTQYAVTFNSGTSGLHALMLAHDIKCGDEVIVPSFTFISTANAPLFVGATPVFAEIEEETYGLDPDDVNERITSKTKAIVPVHYAGCPCKIRELKEIAEDNNLLLIEDAAESLGARIKDEMVGTFGDSAMFSFCQNKVITTGEGGAIVTNSPDIHKKLELIRSHGRVEKQDYFSSSEHMEYIQLGYNFRLPTMCAALGIAQIEKIDDNIQIRRKKAEHLTAELAKTPKIKPPIPPKDYFHVYQMYTIRIDDTKDVRDDLIKHLTENGITSKIYFEPVHLTRFYAEKFGFREGYLPATEKISEQVLTFHTHPLLEDDDITYITQCIKNFFGERK